MRTTSSWSMEPVPANDGIGPAHQPTTDFMLSCQPHSTWDSDQTTDDTTSGFAPYVTSEQPDLVSALVPHPVGVLEAVVKQHDQPAPQVCWLYHRLIEVSKRTDL